VQLQCRVTKYIGRGRGLRRVGDYRGVGAEASFVATCPEDGVRGVMRRLRGIRPPLDLDHTDEWEAILPEDVVPQLPDLLGHSCK
jgi:hypothetical protein